VAGSSLESAVFAMEELEATAKLVLLTRGLPVRQLDSDQIRDLNATLDLR
jgi:ribulose-5-phosphate 4-epimerase/fuculose-1-phosphate aldolase